jgi:magnesium chelatase family protein
MLATSLTAAVLGVEAHLVRVEADSAPGFPRFTVVGLPDSAVKESEARIRAALRNCGIPFKWDRRITVNLAPASLRKGSAFDRATAVGWRAADGGFASPLLGSVLLVGEVALDGALRPVAGVLPMLLLARRHGLSAALVPAANHREASLAPGLPAHPVASLPEALSLLLNERLPPPKAPPDPPVDPLAPEADLADVHGQALARRALEIAAAGGHNLLLVGPPGSGRRCWPPAAGHPGASLGGRGGRTAAIHSAAGLPAVETPPAPSPPHGERWPSSGGLRPRCEVSLAHGGCCSWTGCPSSAGHAGGPAAAPREAA